jgi:leucine dehydrogenase
MNPFDAFKMQGHEQLVLGQDPGCGYFGIIAIHDTTLGPALGGTRVWQYASTADAVTDALRLAKGMTYKSAVAGLNLGGGKAVIIADPHRPDREALFRAHGRLVHSLAGRYITAADVGTSPMDMEHVRLETPHAAGLLGQSGDPSPVTGFGVYCAMKASAKEAWGSDSLAGKTVAVQGVGKVAHGLMTLLRRDGAKLVVADIDAEKTAKAAAEFGATIVDTVAITTAACDIFSPNALGATIDDAFLAGLRAPVICGGANNQLAEPRHGDELARRGIVYAPDYVANGGGVINIYGELNGWPESRARQKASEIYDTTTRVFAIARRDGVPTYVAADRLAEERLAVVRGLRRMAVPSDRR